MEFLLVGTIHFGETPDVVSFTDEDKRLIKQQDIEKLIETVANADSLDNLNADILNALATELAEKL